MLELNVSLKVLNRCTTRAKLRMELGIVVSLLGLYLRLFHKL